LPQVAAVGVDLVQVIVLRTTGPVGKQDLPGIVMDGRITDAAAGILQQHGEFARPQIQPAELAAFAVRQPLVALGIIAEIRIPVTVLARLANREDDFVHALRGQGRKPSLSATGLRMARG